MKFYIGNSREFLVKIQTLDAIRDQTIRDKMFLFRSFVELADL